MHVTSVIHARVYNGRTCLISDWPDRESKSLDHVIRKMTHSEGLNTAAYNELDRRP